MVITYSVIPCTRCGGHGPFNLDRRSKKEKQRAWCIECHRQYKAEHRKQNRETLNIQRRQYYDRNRATIRQQQKAAYDADPEGFRARARRFRVEHPTRVIAWSRRTYRRYQSDRVARSREYHQSHRDERLQTQRRYYRLHTEENLSSARRWRRENPDQVRANHQARRARRRGATGRYSARQWQALCDWFGEICLQCQRMTKLTPDHVIPLVCGGSNDIANIQPLCQSCNCSKGAKTIDYRNPDQLAAFLASLTL